MYVQMYYRIYAGNDLQRRYFSLSAASDKTDGLNVRVRRGKCDIDIYVDNSVKEGEWRFSVGGVTYNTDTIRLFPSLNGKNITISRKK